MARIAATEEGIRDEENVGSAEEEDSLPQLHVPKLNVATMPSIPCATFSPPIFPVRIQSTSPSIA